MKTVNVEELNGRLGKFIGARNISANNQFEIKYANGSAFQSYNTLIGAKIGNDLYLSEWHNFSSTTSKYCAIWCGLDTKTRNKMLTNGMITQISGVDLPKKA